jgi:predicted DNA-binding transcriptional regulator AlpA
VKGIAAEFIDYKYLEQNKIVTNRMCLARAIELYGFPKPVALGANRLAWHLDEVQAWIASRPRRAPKTGKSGDPDETPLLSNHTLPVWVGVDASVKRDSTAIVAVTWDRIERKVRVVWHRVWQPSAAEPLDFEATVEAALKQLKERFRVKEVRYDPYQMQAVAQRLLKYNVPMVEFPQSVPNLTEASTNLYELIKGANLGVYPDDAMRLSIQRAVAVEMPRGWRIAKEKQSHKIDVVIALGMAALGAVQCGIGHRTLEITPETIAAVSRPGPYSGRRPNRFDSRPRMPMTFAGSVSNLAQPAAQGPAAPSSSFGSVSYSDKFGKG